MKEFCLTELIQKIIEEEKEASLEPVMLLIKVLIGPLGGSKLDVNTQTETNKWTALMLASCYSNLEGGEELVKYLLNKGADVTIKSSSGKTALHYSSEYSNTHSTEKTVKMLLDAGSDPNSQDNDEKWTPLHYACRYSDTTSTEGTVKMLLDAGADVNIVNVNGYTPLYFAAKYSGKESTVKMLLDAGANIENILNVIEKRKVSKETKTLILAELRRSNTEKEADVCSDSEIIEIVYATINKNITNYYTPNNIKFYMHTPLNSNMLSSTFGIDDKYHNDIVVHQDNGMYYVGMPNSKAEKFTGS